MRRAKKGQVFIMLLVVVTIISFTAVYMVMIDKKNNFEKALGERQYSIIKTANNAQKALYYVDQSAEYAKDQAMLDTAAAGGLKTQNCGSYIGFSMWTKDCLPKPKESFSEFMNEELNKWFLKYPEAFLPMNNYDFSFKNGKLRADARSNVVFSIGDEELSVVSVDVEPTTVDYDVPSRPVIDIGKYSLPGDTPVVTSCFGERRVNVGSKYHKGVDFRAQKGAVVRAVADGTVKIVEREKWGQVTIDHGWGKSSKYLHLDNIHVNAGEQVKAGTVIGMAGNTAPAGFTVPPHIHYEYHNNGISIDPIQHVFDIEKFKLKFSRNANCVYFMDKYPYKELILVRIDG